MMADSPGHNGSPESPDLSLEAEAADSGVETVTPESWTAHSYGVIAQLLGVSRETVRRDAGGMERPLRVRGLDGKTYPASADGQRIMAAAVLKLRSEGLTQRQIATRLGVSQPTVHRFLRDWRRA